MVIVDAGRRLLAYFTPWERRRAYWLIPVMVTSALMEVVGIASITPFLSLAADPDLALNNRWLAQGFEFLGFSTVTGYLIFLGVAALVMLLLSNGLAALNVFLLQRFAGLQKHRLEMRLMARYLGSPYSRFLDSSSADLGKNILEEVSHLFNGVLIPVLYVIARLFVVVAILAMMLVVDPFLAATVLLTVGGAYVLVFVGVRRRLTRIGEERVGVARGRFLGISEAFLGIKDVRVMHRESSFLEAYRTPSRRYALLTVTRTLINSLPKFALEAIAFGAILVIVLYLLATGREMGQLLPILGLFAFSSYRLMPAVQLIFESIAKVRFAKPALDVLDDDLGEPGSIDELFVHPPFLGLEHAIEYRKVAFRYPSADRDALIDVDLTIPVGSSVALVGATGSGKTTAADLLLGLFAPTSGEILIDGVPLTVDRTRAWQSGIGYVPQSIFLSDSTVAGNIAFGLLPKDIDMDRVERAARVAQLHEFVSGLTDGYLTRVGERGVKLSGGQRQRIGLARALYLDPSVLVLDEATSALDGATEESLFEALDAAALGKTVVMLSHRLATVKSCDQIVLLSGGRVIARGSFEELLAGEPEFQAMVYGQDLGDRPLRATETEGGPARV
jgi:ABC-type bacteriocin/lantibiotic exporter with double-glycine peptidase domain